MSSALTLAAEDAADLEIISARLQDAVAQMKDLVFLPKKRTLEETLEFAVAMLGATVMPGSPAQFGDLIATETACGAKARD